MSPSQFQFVSLASARLVVVQLMVVVMGLILPAAGRTDEGGATRYFPKKGEACQAPAVPTQSFTGMECRDPRFAKAYYTEARSCAEGFLASPGMRGWTHCIRAEDYSRYEPMKDAACGAGYRNALNSWGGRFCVNPARTEKNRPHCTITGLSAQLAEKIQVPILILSTSDVQKCIDAGGSALSGLNGDYHKKLPSPDFTYEFERDGEKVEGRAVHPVAGPAR